MNYRTSIFRVAIFLALSSATSSNADVSIKEIDVTAAASLQEPGLAWQQIVGRNGFYIFEGLDVPLLNIGDSSKGWFIEDARLQKWLHEFPRANASVETVGLPDGTVIGGPTSNHLRYMKRKGEDAFALIPGAVDLYWSDYVEGADIVFAKRSRDGQLLVFDGESFLPSPVPEKGRTRLGEFLPWYSTALDGYFTAWAADIWFFRLGDQDWRPIKEHEIRSWSSGWGFFERGSQEILSPDGSLLKVISGNKIGLRQYRITDNIPTEMLPLLAGHWYSIGDTGDIVGWQGFWHRSLFSAKDHEKVEEQIPRFVRIPPNSEVPEPFPNIRPKLLTHDEDSISYQFRFSNMPGTDRLYFLHEDGFAYYSNGQVSLLPAEWLKTVGKSPHFHTTSHTLYIAAKNGLFLVGQDDTLTELVANQSNAGFGVTDRVFDLACDGLSVGFFGWMTGIYALSSKGDAELVMQSSAPLEPYGVMPDGKSILFSEKDGYLKLLSVDC